ncbi:hypothetical protein MBAV_002799 [Candidatus Magnetobacterium bavaricum]|uniref:Uncharacterized protein n=1 Tax=Candidatus Magnetobacterium bavaricum TaxID=29290 RepID=A0A0F3GT24_9BACT|nr:hypothetical protein MBAV_002799 [Candidatus Magnetobacterium bavaricum]
MQYPDNIKTIANGYIKNNVFTNRETSQSGIDFIPVSAHVHKPCELPACFFNFIKEFVSLVRVVLSHIKPDFLEVIFSLFY